MPAPLPSTAVRFLIVDDEPFVRVIVMRMLQVLTFLVETDAAGERRIGLQPGQPTAYAGQAEIIQAGHGREALALLDRHTVDCIISDIRMPVMSGLELLRAVRGGESPADRETRFALLTAHAEPELVSAAMALDVNAFLTKPVAARTLEARLVRLFAEGWLLRDEAAYRQVPVPTAGTPVARRREEPKPDRGAAAQALWSDRKTPESALVARTPVARPLDHVPENAVLARPIVGPTREPVMAAGTVLTRLLLNRLQELSEMGIRTDEIWIYPPA